MRLLNLIVHFTRTFHIRRQETRGVSYFLLKSDPFPTTNSSLLVSRSYLSLKSSQNMSEFKYHQAKPLIGPSLLASDMSNLSNESARVIDAGADFLHLDVMDGHFVPNLTFGAPVIACLRKNTKAILDVHLMVMYPEKWIKDMAEAGADIFTFHVEIRDEYSEIDEVLDIITKVKERGMKVGLAVKPMTRVEAIFPYLHLLDQVLIMTVEPGFGGQKFMSDMMPKVRAIRERCPDLNIEVDGGLAPETIDEAAQAGANMIVAGSAVFKSSPANVISVLRRSVEKHGNGKDEQSLSPLIEA